MKVGKAMVEIKAPESAIARVQVLHDVLCDVGPMDNTPIELRVRRSRRTGPGRVPITYRRLHPCAARVPLPGPAADPQAHGGSRGGGRGGLGPLPSLRLGV